MDGEGVERVVKTQSHLELDRGVAEHRGDRPNGHGRPRGDETGAGGDAHQTGDGTGCHAHSGGFGVAPGFHQGPGHQAGRGGDVGCGEGQFRAADGQLTAAVEAEPAKPEQPRPQDDLGHVMGRPPGLGPLFAGAHQAGQHQS